MKHTQIASMSDVTIKNTETKKIESTPFTMVDVEGGYILTIGQNCVGEYIFENEDDVKEYITENMWNLIGAMIMVATKHAVKEEIGEVIKFMNKMENNSNNVESC